MGGGSCQCLMTGLRLFATNFSVFNIRHVLASLREVANEDTGINIKEMGVAYTVSSRSEIRLILTLRNNQVL